MLLYADLHIHSCLSPCADELMTPNNIANMALIKGLDIIAVTDHNTCAQLPAVAGAAKRAGVTLVPGMELETQEEVHTLAYFPSVEAACAFSREIYRLLPDIKCNTHFFGEQTLLDENDEPVGCEEKLLLSPVPISLERGFAMLRDFGGAGVPAHIDRPGHGMIPMLGFINPHLGVRCVEISPRGAASGFAEFDPSLRLLSSSDAHRLEDILERVQALELKQNSAEAVIAYARGN